MRIIYSYITREILAVALSTVAVLTFMLVIVNVFKDGLDLLLQNDVPLSIVIRFVVLLIPFVLTFTLPWGFLLGVLIVFGRLSQDRELLAIKASGIGLVPVVAPAVLMSLLASMLSFWITAYVGPQCRDAFKQIGTEVLTQNPTSLFSTETAIDKIPNMRVWIARKEGREINGVNIWRLNANNVPVQSIRAESGWLQMDFPNQVLKIHLRNARVDDRDLSNPTDTTRVRQGVRAEDLVVPIPMGDVLGRAGNKSLGIQRIDQIYEVITNPMLMGDRSPIPFLYEMQKRMAFPLSCFTFVLVGIPLAIQTQRRETSVGVALSLVIALSYYLLTTLAEALKGKGGAYPDIIIWVPNLLFQLVGIVLLARANKR